MSEIKTDPRFRGIEPFESRVWLSSPTMHGDEQRWVDEAIQTNWVSTVGANINEVGKDSAAIRVVSRMFNIRFDTLYQRYQREHRRKRLAIMLIITLN